MSERVSQLANTSDAAVTGEVIEQSSCAVIVENTAILPEFCAARGVGEQKVFLAVFQLLLGRYNATGIIEVGGAELEQQCEVMLPASAGDTLDTVLNAHPAIQLSADEFVCRHFSVRNSVKELTLFMAVTAVNDGYLFRFSSAQQYVLGVRCSSIAAHFEKLLGSALAQPALAIGALPMLPDNELHQLVHNFNDTLCAYPDATVVDLFEKQAQATPENFALFCGDLQVTYGDLNKRANQLARHLVKEGVAAGDNVALIVTRSIDMVCGMLAILKCGAAYVPVTPDTPADRQEYILKQSSVSFVVCNADCQSLSGVMSIPTVDMCAVNYGSYEGDNLCKAIDRHQLAYTIYTSGSTGVPKGVMVEHHSVVNLISWVNKRFNVGADDRLLCVTSMTFDLSVYDIFGMLAAGGAVVIAQKEDVPDVAKVAELLQRHKITFWNSVPSTMDFLISRISNVADSFRMETLRLVFLSGDWIPVSLPGNIRNFFPNAEVVSLGGATEATVWSNYFCIGEVGASWKSIPYGKPMDNNAFYVLNEHLQPVPAGVVGELYIGGVGVARGYANDTEKTQAAFISDPFTDKWGGLMYKTGDLGRMLPCGNMEFIGRKDRQVKVRGYRVELGEVESVIGQFATVAKAVVLLSADKKQLVGYIVPEKYYDRDTLIAYTKKKLPDYMVPGKWIEIEEIPLTANGKIDTSALRAYDRQSGGRKALVAPRNERETKMLKVWKSVLKVEEIGIEDNFFDLGGQSLVAVELITELERALQCHFPVNILYKCGTVSELSAYIEKEGTAKKWKSLVAIRPTGTKTPVYIVHGDGLSLSNFQNLAAHLDDEQPVYSLQPVGLNGVDAPLEDMHAIAGHYISEIIEHNPDGPYVLGGYSFGGYVAIEMKRQLECMGRKVKMVAIFDTDAENVNYKKDWKTALPRRIKRQVPKLMFIAKSMITSPVDTIKYQYSLLTRKIDDLTCSLGIKEKTELTGISRCIAQINENNLKAFKNYNLTPFEDRVHLFKAQKRHYFVDDFKFLGWSKYAKSGVEVYDVPGDHKTMFQQPNVRDLARSFQEALNNC